MFEAHLGNGGLLMVAERLSEVSSAAVALVQSGRDHGTHHTVSISEDGKELGCVLLVHHEGRATVGWEPVKHPERRAEYDELGAARLAHALDRIIEECARGPATMEEYADLIRGIEQHARKTLAAAGWSK
jgi:hypothetical protein